MKHKKSRGLFDEEFRLDKLSKQQDPLERLKNLINWDQFNTILSTAFTKDKRGRGGRPSYGYVLMFKILILQRFYNLSDDQLEFQILDRLSFMRFLGLRLSDNVPDSKTIWLFKENLIKHGIIEALFNQFNLSLQAAGLIVNEGKIVDASFVEVPKQRNTRDENGQIKEGQIPEGWKAEPHKLSQKDTDARWTKKNNTTYYGYKNHVKADAGSKLIESFTVTPASVHDSQELVELLEESDKGQSLHADSAYTGKEIAEQLEFLEIKNEIHEKGSKSAPLTQEQIDSNHVKSKIRVRVEHIFGFIENSMNGSTIRSIGIERAKGLIGLMNLTYNMLRSIQLIKIQGRSLCI